MRHRFFDEVRPGGNSKTSKWTAEQTTRFGERILSYYYIKNCDSLKINLKINLILKIIRFVLNIKFSQNISFCRIITTFSGVKLTDLNRNRTAKLIKTWHLTLNSYFFIYFSKYSKIYNWNKIKLIILQPFLIIYSTGNREKTCKNGSKTTGTLEISFRCWSKTPRQSTW